MGLMMVADWSNRRSFLIPATSMVGCHSTGHACLILYYQKHDSMRLYWRGPRWKFPIACCLPGRTMLVNRESWQKHRSGKRETHCRWRYSGCLFRFVSRMMFYLHHSMRWEVNQTNARCPMRRCSFRTSGQMIARMMLSSGMTPNRIATTDRCFLPMSYFLTTDSLTKHVTTCHCPTPTIVQNSERSTCPQRNSRTIGNPLSHCLTTPTTGQLTVNPRIC